MKKLVYTMEQVEQLARFINELTVTGINNCKLVALCTQVIDNPTETIEEEEGVK